MTGDKARRKGARKPIITPGCRVDRYGPATVRYDKDGDDHYDVISAFIKSMRGSDPDAAIHYLARMIRAGEDPFHRPSHLIAAAEKWAWPRRRFCRSLWPGAAVALVGMRKRGSFLPRRPLAVATAPKSNASYNAINEALADVDAKGISAPCRCICQRPHQAHEGMGATTKATVMHMTGLARWLPNSTCLTRTQGARNTIIPTTAVTSMR